MHGSPRVDPDLGPRQGLILRLGPFTCGLMDIKVCEVFLKHLVLVPSRPSAGDKMSVPLNGRQMVEGPTSCEDRQPWLSWGNWGWALS